MTIIWCLVPEIRSITDINFCHSGLFFALLPPYGPRKSKFWKNEKNTWRYYHFTNVYHKWQSYDVWFLRYGVQQTEFFVILDRFLPFYPPMDPENQNFQKNGKNTWRYYHFTNINDSHMIYGSSDMEWNGQNFLTFWTIFCPKNKNFEKMKKLLGDIIILHKCNINDNHMMYGSWDMKCNGQNFLSFSNVFCPFIPITTQKIKILKNWKKHLEIPSVYTSAPKIMIICYTIP